MVIVTRLTGNAGATFWGHRLELAATEVAATAKAATATITAGHDRAHNKHRLAGRRRDHEVGVDVLLAKLLRNVQACKVQVHIFGQRMRVTKPLCLLLTQGSIIVVDVTLRLIAQYRVGLVHLLELQKGISNG